MQKYKKFAIVSITIVGILYAITSKVGIITMLISSAMLLIIVLLLFIVWAMQKPNTRQNLKSFSLNYDNGKQVVFSLNEDSTYDISIQREMVDYLNVHKYELTDKKTQTTSRLSKKLAHKWLKKQDSTLLSKNERITEKQAIAIYLHLLKNGKKYDLISDVYILRLIQTFSKPKFLTVKKVIAISNVKRNLGQIGLAPTLPFSKEGQKFSSAPAPSTAKNSIFAPILAFSTVEMQVLEMAQNESIDTLFTLFAFIVMLLVVLQYVTKLVKRGISDFSDVQITGKCSRPPAYKKPCYKKDIFK